MSTLDTKEILDILSPAIRNLVLSYKNIPELQEIRIRVNKPIVLICGDKEIISSYNASNDDLKGIVQRISNYSIYAFEEEVRQGFITIKGGHRVGICGHCIIDGNKIKTIKDISSLNIRVCRQVIGCSNKILKYIFNKDDIYNTIIISPPRCGKTTLLRDIARNLAEGKNCVPKKVTVIDERSEIAGCSSGVPQLDLGLRSDVLDCCPKSDGIMMAIRSMGPDVIVCDEIGTKKDMESIVSAVNCGIKLITSIHGYGILDLYNRNVFKEIVENKIFERAIILSSLNGAGTIEYIQDIKNKNNIWEG